MNSWDKERVDSKYKQKLHAVKSSLPRVNNNPTTSNGLRKKTGSGNQGNSNSYPSAGTSGRKNNEYNKQTYLKHLLNEFGLGQYLRKMFEVGYDDNTINRLGMLSYKNFEELLLTLRIFPGHQIKMNHLYEYLRQMNLYKGVKKPKTSNGQGKRYHSYNSAVRTMGRTAYQKSSSLEHKNYRQPSNSIVGSFLKGDFGLNYYLEDNNLRPIEKAKLEHNDSNGNDEPLLMMKMEEESIREKRKEDTDKMLSYYMEKLNERLDDSYGSIDDSSLSNVHCKEIMFSNNDQRNIENISEIRPVKEKENVTMTYSLINNKSVSTKKENETNKSNNASNPRMEVKGQGNSNSNSNSNNQGASSNNNSQIRNETTKNSIIPSKESQSLSQPQSQPHTTKNKETGNIVINGNNEEIQEEIVKAAEPKTEGVIEDKKPVSYEEHQTEDIIVEDIKTKSNIKPNHLQQPSSPSESQSASEYASGSQSEYISASASQSSPRKVEMKTEGIQAKLSSSSPSKSNQSNHSNTKLPFTKEETMFDNIRLTKSFEADSLRQNTEQFDIEYMCRCLGLAIMRHLESSKDKQHITELVDIKEMFSFYGSLYNSKIDFIFNFFNQSQGIQPISNLDRIDMEEAKSKENAKEKDIGEYGKETGKQISFVNHVKDKTMSELPEIKTKKLKTGLGDIEKDIKFIDEFFSSGNSNKKRSYNNYSDKTKNVLCKELSYINEVSFEQSQSVLKCNESHSNTSNILLPQLSFTNHHNQHNQSHDEDTSLLNNTNPLPSNNKFSNIPLTPLMKPPQVEEDIPEHTPTIENNKEHFESGSMESNYMIDASSVDKLKSYLFKQSEIYDDDYIYQAQRIQTRKYVPLPDPQAIFEFCANIMILTKMEKEVIIVTLIYLERLIFNTGLLLTSRNWRRITFTAMIMASKIWDDDSYENNHFAQVFTHLSIGEINFMERVYLELINYKVYVKCSEYFKYFFVIKSIALKYNFNGMNLVEISVERMMKIQEYAYQMQKKMKKKYSLSNSAQF